MGLVRMDRDRDRRAERRETSAEERPGAMAASAV
jgi:hypothetical protein